MRGLQCGMPLALAVALCLRAPAVQASQWLQCRLADGSSHVLQAPVAGAFVLAMSACNELATPSAPVGAALVSPSIDDHAEYTDVRVIEAPAARARFTAADGWHGMPQPPSAFVPWMQAAEDRHQIPFALLSAVMFVESRYDPRARSQKGALGLMQLMPSTGRRYGVDDAASLLEPRVNIEVGAAHLRVLIDLFPGRLDLALAAYNAGEAAVLRFGGRVPPYEETRAYVRRVLALLP